MKRRPSANSSAVGLRAKGLSTRSPTILMPAILAPLARALHLHFLQRLAEILRRLELTVHRGEADVGDLVEPGELAHHHVADARSGHLALAQGAKAILDLDDRRFQRLGLHRALAQRDLHA